MEGLELDSWGGVQVILPNLEIGWAQNKWNNLAGP